MSLKLLSSGREAFIRILMLAIVLVNRNHRQPFPIQPERYGFDRLEGRFAELGSLLLITLDRRPKSIRPGVSKVNFSVCNRYRYRGLEMPLQKVRCRLREGDPVIWVYLNLLFFNHSACNQNHQGIKNNR
jgi:hypothetical protein